MFAIFATSPSPQQSSDEKTSVEQKTTTSLFETTFDLPIYYLKNKELLSSNIIKDLELINTLDNNDETNGVYKVLFDITTGETFKRQMANKWSQYYTTDEDFITDSINIVKSVDLIDDNSTTVNDETIINIWKDLKEDEYFLEKYSYMEWSYLENLNNSSFFLWLYACMNIISPLMTLFIPLLFFVLPVVLMIIYWESFSFENYYSHLKSLSKQHFIGGMLSFFDGSMSWDKLSGALVSLLFYGISIYQNIIGGYHFYNNMKQLNEHLIDIRKYLQVTDRRINTFLKSAKGCLTYNPFINDLKNHQNVIQMMINEVENVREFAIDFRKCGELGELLSSFYKFHKNTQYENTLRYSMGFNGYFTSIVSLKNHHELNRIGSCKFIDSAKDDKPITIQQQYYPFLGKHESVKNDISIDKSILLTGSNGCGKSTLMKTTMLNLILSQQIGFGFYENMEFKPYKHFHCYLNIVDTGANNDSLFMAQSRRSKEIMEAVSKGESHFCILDEIFCGTEIKSCHDSCVAFIDELLKNEKCRFILSTHIADICNKRENDIANYQMEVIENSEDETIKNTYRLVPGISNIRGAVNIFKKMDFPESFINNVRSMGRKKKSVVVTKRTQ
jgi:DNA mismatch repair ATPase MutS